MLGTKYNLVEVARNRVLTLALYNNLQADQELLDELIWPSVRQVCNPTNSFHRFLIEAEGGKGLS